RVGDRKVAAGLTVNIASLYGELGEIDAADEWLSKGMADVAAEELPKVQLHLAKIRFRQGKRAESLALYIRVIEASGNGRDHALYARTLHHLGEEYFRADELAEAEWALLASWRIASLRRIPADAPYFYIARVWLAEGKLAPALEIADRLVERVGQP